MATLRGVLSTVRKQGLNCIEALLRGPGCSGRESRIPAKTLHSDRRPVEHSMDSPDQCLRSRSRVSGQLPAGAGIERTFVPDSAKL